LKCPRDQSELTMHTVHDINVKTCDECGGMFLEHGELNKVAEPTAGDIEFSMLDMEDFKHEDGLGPIACPRDTDLTMSKIDFNIYTNIILDYCQRCHAFWIDATELARINDEVKNLNEAAREVPDPPMLWFAKFIWNLPFSS
jgi:Zn-finger nucleic acid-binding protein